MRFVLAIALVMPGIVVGQELPHDTELLKTLTVEQAQALVKREDVYLYLNGLTAVTPDVAQALAKQKGTLFLNGLATLTPEVARELAQLDGDLFLNGLTDLSPEVGKALAGHKGVLMLKGLAALSLESAEALAQLDGQVFFGDSTKISPEAAKALAGTSIQRGGGHAVRNVNWGDSIEKVLDSEKELTFRRQSSDPLSVSLISNEQEDLCNEKATVRFDFYENRLIGVTYDIDISKTDNPFEHDISIRHALEEKYGKGPMKKFPQLDRGTMRVLQTTVEIVGLTEGPGGPTDLRFDLSKNCHRKSEWALPNHSITLLATSYPNRGEKAMQKVFVEYLSQEGIELRKQRKKQWDDDMTKKREKDRSKL